MPRINKNEKSHTTIRIKRDTRDQLLKIKASKEERMEETIERILQQIDNDNQKLMSEKKKGKL